MLYWYIVNHVSTQNNTELTLNSSDSVVGIQTWINVILNSLHLSWNHPVILEVAFKHWFWHTFVSNDGYSISDRIFLTADLILSWHKVTPSSPFQFTEY